jgi:hypothetical protein
MYVMVAEQMDSNEQNQVQGIPNSMSTGAD